MKHLLLTTIAAVVLVGCGEAQSPEPPIAKAPDNSIHNAAYYGKTEAVKQHLAAGADVKAKDILGGTPLHYTALGGRKEIAELLIAKGANMNAQLNDGKTPLDLAIQFRRTEIADFLRKHGGKTAEELKAEGK